MMLRAVRPGGVGLYLPVLYGTVRDERRSVHVARYVHRLLEKRADVESRLFDPRGLPFENLRRREWEMDVRPPVVDEFVREMGRADGFVIVSPEYNFGIPGALKNMLDALYDEWNRKPFALVGCGGLSGGLRMIDMLRQVIAGVEGIVVPAHVPVQKVGKAFDEDGPVEEQDAWDRRFGKLFDELEWYAKALRAARG